MKKWIIKPAEEREITALMAKFDLPRLVSAILVNRRQVFVDSVLEGRNKANPFHDPFLLKDMQKCIDRIEKAIKSGEKITIYGDFDADGVTSTSILYMYLKSRGAKVSFYIPDRMEEGYGINEAALESIKGDGTCLIITVDTGITAVDDIKRAYELGLEVIVTDHHEPKEVVPDCVAVIDPKQSDCRYPFKELAGVGVVFKLIQAFEGINDDIVKSYMPLVCLGTVADVVPLLDENREFVKMGLQHFSTSGNSGIKALLGSTGFTGKKVTAGNIGFVIAPRINAAGRLGSADKSVSMFLCGDDQTAAGIAEMLAAENRHRQEMEKEIYDEAVRIIEWQGIINDKVIVVANDGWHQGIIGIVSSKITERYNKPSLLISLEGERGKGSGRSIHGVNLFEALCGCSEYLEKFGGHSLAAGFTIKDDDVANFRKAINKYVGQHTKAEDFVPQLLIDAELKNEDLNFKSVEQMQRMEPFGMGNPIPVLMFGGAKIRLISTMTEGKHIRLSVIRNGNILDAVGFGLGHMADDFKVGEIVDIAGVLDINEYRGVRKLQLFLKDIRHARR